MPEAKNRPKNPTKNLARNGKLCVICGKPADEVFKPFCSKRCADVDLHRWLAGVYAVPVTADEEDDERRNEDEGTPH